MVERALIRELRRSAGRAYGYLAFCEYSDRYRNISPTTPIEPPRDDKGYYLNHAGKRYLTVRGRPIKDLYHPDLLPHLERNINPKAKYPAWTDEDLIRACKIEHNPRRHSRDLKDSLRHFEELAELDILSIHTPCANEHHIQPAPRHLNAVRALRQAVKQAEKHSHARGGT